MKDIKKLMITLVALLAMTAGAWADAVPVTELKASDINAWIGDYTALTAADLPGFTAVSDEEVVNIPAPLTNGAIFMIYAFNGTNIKFVNYYNGEQVYKGEDYYNRDNIAYIAFDEGSIIYYTGTAPAPTGPEVAWDNDKKTGQFTMPGGNVELEPEYYPQAALTAAPTAINDVPATTDGAIVNAGTVANIGETTNAQGTVMYYVSTTALDDAALLALAADAWTADVPTAESFTAAGQAYVYYYVRGNDSDTDDEIFSDGDILSANALTVTIAAAPTYAVTFAEGTDPNEWTASPDANVTKGTPVTVTYTGTKKVIGVKAEKKAAAPATVLSGALVDGATIKVNFKWRMENSGDYVQGVYNAASGTFTVSKGGDDWNLDDRAVYKVEKSGDNIIIGAGFSGYSDEAMVWTFNTTNDTYTTTNGSMVNAHPDWYGLISVTLNGTDITSQLTAQ